MDIEYAKKLLKKRLSPKRYTHSVGVCETAVKLAKLYNVSVEKAKIAGLLHDYAKDLSDEEIKRYIKEFNLSLDKLLRSHINLAHGIIGAELVKREFKIIDNDILNAIKYHTTGRKNMSCLEKIVYLADYIEPNRNFPGIEEIRRVSFLNLDEGVLLALNSSITYIIKKGRLLHENSVFARNSIILSKNS